MANINSRVYRTYSLMLSDYCDSEKFIKDDELYKKFVIHRQKIVDVLNGKLDPSAVPYIQVDQKPVKADGGQLCKVYFFVARAEDYTNKFRAAKLVMQQGFGLNNLPQARNVELEDNEVYAQFSAEDVTANEALQLFEQNKHIFSEYYVEVPKERKVTKGEKKITQLPKKTLHK